MYKKVAFVVTKFSRRSVFNQQRNYCKTFFCQEFEEDDSDEESSDDDDDDDDDLDGEDVADVGEEAGKAVVQIENPLFEGSDDSDSDDDSDDFKDSDDSDDDSDDDAEKEKEKKPAFDGEDDLIAALKSAREKKVRESPPDIK